jgi:hypothetical protein
MTKRLKKHASTLHLLSKCDNHTINSVIKAAKPDLIACISDICHNTLKGRVHLSKTDKRKLLPYKNTLRRLANKSETLKTKKLLIQKGHGLLSVLIPLLGSVIGPILNSLK